MSTTTAAFQLPASAPAAARAVLRLMTDLPHGEQLAGRGLRLGEGIELLNDPALAHGCIPCGC